MENSDLNILDGYSFLKTGDKLPDFTWQDETGKNFSSETLHGKVTLIILFTTNCRHCRDNFAYLEKELFKKSISHLNIMAIGRGCNYEQLESYRIKYPIRIKLTADPDNEIYLKFAEKAVPRIYLFDAGGVLLKSIRGYRQDELESTVEFIS